MARRTTVRENVPVGRVSLLVIALACALATWLLFHYQAPGIVTLVMAGVAVSMVVVGFVTLPPGRRYSFASKQDPGRAAPAQRDPFNPPVSRVKLGLVALLLGGLAVLAHWFGADREFVWMFGLCAALYAAAMLLPDRIRRLLAWDLNNW